MLNTTQLDSGTHTPTVPLDEDHEIVEKLLSEVAESSDSPAAAADNVPAFEKPADRREFFRKRATEEISSLQMVDHVLSEIEKKYCIATKPFDDLAAKAAFQSFLKFSDDPDSHNHTDAEFRLKEETTKWSGALSARDRQIKVWQIREFCENSVPVLSSQALVSLACFYRNSPFSSDIREKFDYVFTRLFSRETYDSKRRLLFEYDDMITHIKTLYSNWSSIAAFDLENDEAAIVQIVGDFERMGAMIEQCTDIGTAVRNNWAKQLKELKERTEEIFFVPEVAAAAIGCNVTLGNRWVELVIKEKKNHPAHMIAETIGSAQDNIVSDTTGKTLVLDELLRIEPEEEVEAEPEERTTINFTSTPAVRTAVRKREKLSISKGLLAFAVVAVFACGGILYWSSGTETVGDTVAKSVKLDSSEINANLVSLTASNETLYATAKPTFVLMGDEQKSEFLKMAVNVATERGLKRVNVIDADGRTIAFASKDRIDLYK